jgi:hypothetical protein
MVATFKLFSKTLAAPLEKQPPPEMSKYACSPFAGLVKSVD